MTNQNTDGNISRRPKRDWTQGPIIKGLFLLSWPMVLMESLYVISQIVDMIWVGKLGPAAIAGVGIANMVLMLIMSMDFGLIMGVRAMVSRYVGADNISEANHIAAQAFVLSAFWSSFIMIIGYFLTRPAMIMFGVENAVVVHGTAYMRVMFAGWIALMMLVMGLYIIQSSGDTIRPLIIEILIRIVHVALCPLLVLGLWGFPNMGVAGAALSNVISQAIGVLMVLWLLINGKTRLRLSRKDFRISLNIMRRILKIGIPVLIMNLQRSFGNLMLTFLTAPFGTLAVAAHSLVSRVEMFILLPGYALGMGAGVLVGQNLGAQKSQRAEKVAWITVTILEILFVLASIFILLKAEIIIAVFTSESDLIKLGSIFLRIATASYGIMAFIAVLQNCISSAGDTVSNMIISIMMIWIVLLPAAFLLSKYTILGVYGLRWAIVLSTAFGTIVYVYYFRKGKWKGRKV